MISLIEKYQNNYRTNGWFILKLPEFEQKIKNIKKIFLKTYYSKFTTDVESNRELIKRFVDHPDVLNAIYSHDLISTLKETMNINNLIKCGPCITHYTSNDTTGNSFGVDYHQDYPSMASSSNSFICWITMNNITKKTHGLELLSGYHKSGLLKGRQTQSHYKIDSDIIKKTKPIIPKIKAGEILVFSPFLPHRTFVNPNSEKWKLSLSQRFDDLDDEKWKQKKYKTAFNTTVDRNLFKNTHY